MVYHLLIQSLVKQTTEGNSMLSDKNQALLELTNALEVLNKLITNNPEPVLMQERIVILSRIEQVLANKPKGN